MSFESNSIMKKKFSITYKLLSSFRMSIGFYLVVSIGILHILFVARSNTVADDLSWQQEQKAKQKSDSINWFKHSKAVDDN